MRKGEASEKGTGEGPGARMIKYSAAISACSKGQHPEKASELLEGMQQKDLEQLDVIT